MKNQSFWQTTIAPFLGGALFLIGASRFYTHDDLTGAIIFSMTGFLAIFQAILAHRTLAKLDKDP